MHYKNAAIIVAVAAQQAAAYGWTDASSYSCPGNTNNQCSDQQQGGYDWSGLDEGSFSSYGSNSFSGFKCSQSFGKRDLLTKREFQSKCITGNLDDQPSWSCDGDDSMSIDEMQISSSEDADVDCEYSMPDGSKCHESHSCSSGGSIFKNTQCGGAKSVTFKPGKNAPSGCSIGVHSVGFHCGSASSTVPAYSTPGSTHPASTVPASSSAVPSSSYGCHGPECSTSAAPQPSCAYGEDCSSSASPSSPASSVPASSYGCHGPDCSSSAAPTPSCAYGECSSSAAPTPSCAYGECSSSASPSSPVSSVPASSYGCHGPECSTSAAPTPSCAYGEDCSSSAAPTPSCAYGECSSSASPSSPVSSVPASSYGCHGPDCSSSAAPTPSCAYGEDCSSSAHPVSSTSSSPPNYPTPNCPNLLPRCLNTWMFAAGCKDNTDQDCFCGNEDFINKVMGCISAWSESEEDTQAAASYLMGICAKHVPTNPAIITACPSTVTPVASVPPTYPASSVPESSPVSSVPGYTPGSSASPKPTSAPVYSSAPVPSGHPSSPATPETTAPCTTITYSSDATVPATYSTGPSAGYTMTGSSYTTKIVTTVTVPQVQFTTGTVTVSGKETPSVGLGAGSPSSAPAYTTPAASAPGAYGSSAAPVGGAGTTLGTTYAPGPSASYSPITPATGAAAKVGSGIGGIIIGAIAAVAAL